MKRLEQEREVSAGPCHGVQCSMIATLTKKKPKKKPQGECGIPPRAAFGSMRHPMTRSLAYFNSSTLQVGEGLSHQRPDTRPTIAKERTQDMGLHLK